MAQRIVNSHHSGCFVCGKLLKGHWFDPQRTADMQSTVNSHCKASPPPRGKVHCDSTESAQRSIWKQVHMPRSAQCTWSGQPVNCGVLRLLREAMVILQRISVIHIEVQASPA